MIPPIILRAYTPSIAPGAVVANAGVLRNLTGRSLRVNEIRFFPERTSAPLFAALTPWLAATTVQLRIGNTPITEQFIPLAAFVEAIDLSMEAGGESEDTGSTGARVLRFRQPVVLAPRETITYSILQNTAATFDMRVTAVCEEASESGVTPWIAVWSSTPRLDGSGDYEESSTEADLVNPFNTPMFVERFIGRLVYDGSILTPGLSGAMILNFDKVRVRIDDHRNRQIVRDPTPFGNVFDYILRGWQVNSTLDARGFYRVSIDKRLSTQVISGRGAGNVQAMIGMLGYHTTRE